MELRNSIQRGSPGNVSKEGEQSPLRKEGPARSDALSVGYRTQAEGHPGVQAISDPAQRPSGMRYEYDMR